MPIPRLERGLYYVTCYEYYKRKIYKHDQRHNSIMEIDEQSLETNEDLLDNGNILKLLFCCYYMHFFFKKKIFNKNLKF